MKKNGFTLIELMVTLAVLAIAVSIAVPSYQDYIANQRVKTASQNLFMSLLLARSEAVKRNQSVTVSANGSWDKGWVVTTASKSYDQCLSDQTGCVRVEQPKSSVAVDTSSATTLTFLRNGRLSGGGAASVEFCDSAGRATKRAVSLSLTGQPVISQQGSCS